MAVRIDLDILEDIHHKAGKLDKRWNKHFSLRNRRESALDEEALCHSGRIEYPLGRVYRTSDPSQKAILKEQIEQVKKQLREAWVWAKDNYEEPIGHQFLFEVLGRIDPSNYGNIDGKYRSEQVKIKGSRTIPPRPEKVHGEMNVFFDKLASETYNSEVERAVFAHLELVRIHPYIDGNGRTARLLQNRILRESGLPPAIVREGERDYYKSLVEQAIYAQKHEAKCPGESESERNLANYLGSKVAISLDRLLDRKKTKSRIR